MWDAQKAARPTAVRYGPRTGYDRDPNSVSKGEEALPGTSGGTSIDRCLIEICCFTRRASDHTSGRAAVPLSSANWHCNVHGSALP